MLRLAPEHITNPSHPQSCYSLGPKAHAKAGQVAIGEREDDHEDDEPGVMREYNRQVVTGLYVAQHEKRDKDDTEGHQHWQEAAILPRLEEKHSPEQLKSGHSPSHGMLAGAAQRLSLLCQGCGGATETAKLLKGFLLQQTSVSHHCCCGKEGLLGLNVLLQMTWRTAAVQPKY